MTCGGPGVSDAYYCKECTVQEKDVSILQLIHVSLPDVLNFFVSFTTNCGTHHLCNEITN